MGIPRDPYQRLPPTVPGIIAFAEGFSCAGPILQLPLGDQIGACRSAGRWGLRQAPLGQGDHRLLKEEAVI